MATLAESCPKHMTYGPCGGVNPDGSCEVPGLRCPFVEGGVARWEGQASESSITPAGQAFLQLMNRRPVIVTDIPTVPLDAASAEVLAGAADTVLLGDHGGARVQFPPAYRAMLVKRTGLEPWVGLNCRDRNRVALEAELAALKHLGVAGVHAVTGDHPVSGHRPDALPVFDLDSAQLASLARAKGLLVSVAESPCAIPRPQRPFRLLQKVRAGGRVCFVNHAGGREAVGEFVAAAQSLGADVPFISGVAVITSLDGAQQIQTFRNLVLPAGYLEGILNAPDPRKAGIKAAIALGEELLSVTGVRGLNLSAAMGSGDKLELACDLAEIGRAFL